VIKKLAKDMAMYLPSQFLPALTALITTPILTRLFHPAEYGYWALAVGASGFLLALAASGYASSIMRFLPAYAAKSELNVFFATLNGSLTLGILLVNFLSFGVLFLLKGFLPVELYQLLWISILLFDVQTVLTIYLVVLRTQDRSGMFSFFTLLVKYGALGFGLVLVLIFGMRIEGVVWGEVVVTAICLPVLIYLTTRGITGGVHLRLYRSADAVQFWKYAWPLNLGNMAMWALVLSDRFIIGIFRSASEVGLYSAAYNLSSKSIDILVQLFLLSMGPMIINIWESQGREAAENALAAITRVFLVVCLPAAVGLYVLSHPFMAILTDTAYQEGYRIIGYVGFSSFAYGLSQIASRGMLIAKDTWRLGINQILAAAINVGLNLMLVPRYGYVAAGITTLIGYLILFILQAHGSRAHLTWRFPFRTLWNVIIASVLMGLAVSTVYALAPIKDQPVNAGYLIFSIVAGVLVYFGAMLLLGEMTSAERNIAMNFLKRKKTAESV